MQGSGRFDASLSDNGRYRMLIEAITDYAIYMLDSNGIVSSWNPGARRFKGYEAPEIVGEHFSRFYTEADRAAGLPQRALETAAREGKFESEGWRVRKDGSEFLAHIAITALKNPDGEDYGSYGTSWHISYVLRTANSWAGPIGKFTLTLDKGDPKNVISLCADGVKKTGPTTFVVEKTDYTPDRDLEVLVVQPMTYE